MILHLFIFLLFLPLFKTDEDLWSYEDDGEVIQGFQKCYDELGCITTDHLWYDENIRPVNLKPLERHILKTEFLLIQKKKPVDNTSIQLTYNTISATAQSVRMACFNTNYQIVMLIHDFTSNGYTGWIKHISYELLLQGNINIISVDWQRGAEPPFDLAISNARVVSLEIVQLLNLLRDQFNMTVSGLHLIGHGVGAHIAGYVGIEIKNISKITALDPTGIRFAGMPDVVKLNKHCAKYVEVLHTDTQFENSQGTKELMGHSDFFINNAHLQPGCQEFNNFTNLTTLNRNDLSEGEILTGCSHKRSFKYFIESLWNKDCNFFGIECISFEKFIKGHCDSCGKNGKKCRTFNLDFTVQTTKKHSYFLDTNEEPPYCMFAYSISVYLSKDAKKEYHGYFDFIFVDQDDNVANVTERDSEYMIREFKPKSNNTYVYYAEPPRLTKIVEMKIRWNEKKKFYCFIHCDQEIMVEKVVLRPIYTKERDIENHLCPVENSPKIENGIFTTFKICNDGESSKTNKNQKNRKTHICR